MSELISKISVSPDYTGTFTPTIEKLANGELDINELLNTLHDKSSKYIKELLDEINGKACLYCVGMSGVPIDNIKANRLFNAVEKIEAELQGGGYQNSHMGGGGSQSMGFPQENLEDTSSLPIELRTPQAMVYWQKLKEEQFVASDFKPLGLQKKQMSVIAVQFSTALGLRCKYKPFADLWGCLPKSMQALASRAKRLDDKEIWYKNIEKIFKS